MTSRHWARSGLSLCDFLILGVIKNLKIKVNSLHRSEVEVADCVLHMFKQTFIYIEEYPNQTHSFLSNSFNIIVNVMSQLKISEEFIFA